MVNKDLTVTNMLLQSLFTLVYCSFLALDTVTAVPHRHTPDPCHRHHVKNHHGHKHHPFKHHGHLGHHDHSEATHAGHEKRNLDRRCQEKEPPIKPEEKKKDGPGHKSHKPYKPSKPEEPSDKFPGQTQPPIHPPKQPEHPPIGGATRLPPGQPPKQEESGNTKPEEPPKNEEPEKPDGSSHVAPQGPPTPSKEGLRGIASTTLYADSPGGACGCYDDKTKKALPWQAQSSGNFYTAAANEYLFHHTGGVHWCGSGCGICYELTSMGHSDCQNCGVGSSAGEKIIVMVTNLCPPSPHYCVPRGQQNQAGVEAHFDIYSDPANAWKINDADWGNPLVSYQPIDCPNPFGSYYNSQSLCLRH